MKISVIIGLVMAVFATGLGSCAIEQAATRTVPAETLPNCESFCSKMGLKLTAVVIIMNSAGCVCERASTASARRTGSTTVAGAAIIHAAREAARQQQEKKKKSY